MLHAIFDPLDRPPEHDRGDDRGDVARVDADLVAEAAADVRRDDPHLALRDAREQRHHRAHHVRRLRGDVDRQLPVDLVERGDAAAGLQRAGMDPRGRYISSLDRHLGLREGACRCASLSPTSQVKMWLWCLRGPCAPSVLSVDVLAQERRIGVHRLDGHRPAPAAPRTRPRPARPRRRRCSDRRRRRRPLPGIWKSTFSSASTACTSPASVGIQCRLSGFRSSAVSTAMHAGHAPGPCPC